MTLQGLPGVGDLVLTCTGELSRNKALGRKIGMGVTPADATKGIRTVVEGLRGAAVIRSMARELNIEMPIVEVVSEILFDGLSPSLAVERLLNRPLRHELDTKCESGGGW
jgi:glycerol-3-phosphate dehydrogenase (NAD(P)+)